VSDSQANDQDVEEASIDELRATRIRQTREINSLRAALVKSVEVIRTWHNQGIPVRECSKLWDIYWRNAPEMKQIREALAALQEVKP